jgi:hypothetical protein
MEKDGIKTISIKPYKLKEIAALYGLHRDTMREWLKLIKDKVGERKGHYYNIDQVRTIFDVYKLPSYVQIKDETRYFE